MRLPRKWTPLQLEQAVKESKSLSDVLRKLGLRPAGGNHATIRNWIVKLNIDNSHFNPYAGMAERHRHTRSKTVNFNTVLTVDSKFGRGTVKRFAKQCIPHSRCAICNLLPIWNKQLLVFQLDHINGNSNDHRKENLRWICPNCHTQTPSFAGRSSHN